MSEVAERLRRHGAGIGSAALRKEDDRLLRGDGRFTDDVQPAHALHMAVGRCPFPHARVARIDVSQAIALEGVRQVLAGAEIVALTEPISVLRPVPGAPKLPYYALAPEVCVFEGQPFVSVVATSRHVAEDAVERVDVEWEPLPHVTDTLGALEPDAPVLHPAQLPGNLLVSNPQGTDTADAIADADVVVEDRFHVNRVTGLPMEPRAVVAEWRPGARMLTAHCST
ncbi:MAG: molybdopterin cofactor-binding domain-containing protein, partial [Solirubrobacteraceae bacterium]